MAEFHRTEEFPAVKIWREACVHDRESGVVWSGKAKTYVGGWTEDVREHVTRRSREWADEHRAGVWHRFEEHTNVGRRETSVADWIRSAVARVSSLTALAPGWDSYGAPPVEADSALQAVEFLLGVALPHLPPPAIVPLSDGGIQLEWHEGGVDLEISFSDREPGVYVEDRDGGEAAELPLDQAARVLARFAARLAPA